MQYLSGASLALGANLEPVDLKPAVSLVAGLGALILLGAALATSAAPTYFPAAHDPWPRRVHRRRPLGQPPGDRGRRRGPRLRR